ncbi:hypothetical protein [Neorhizobium galegae]|uniref:hypothetical protein n=1 Tax=Neorhizobium galegae TaxID=399 RepID=UPI002102BA47|nr:hypothetical protein [Neorhizobium galegae]MCQ1855368.1 hypothetical protein [Neorhizobium galegae]
MKSDIFPRTPDGRYMVVRGRLWRLGNPGLPEDARQELVSEFMNSRRAVRDAGEDGEAKAEARSKVDAAKVALGERGPVWWEDGAPDFNRKLAKNTPYRDWFAALTTP